jgi:cell division protein FtsB
MGKKNLGFLPPLPHFEITPNRLWFGVFSVWALLLSGILSDFIGSPPGVLQAIRLRRLLDAKQAQMAKLEETVLELQSEAETLEKNKLAQQREIRRVLGYVASDEIVFDFSGGEAL